MNSRCRPHQSVMSPPKLGHVGDIPHHWCSSTQLQHCRRGAHSPRSASASEHLRQQRADFLRDDRRSSGGKCEDKVVMEVRRGGQLQGQAMRRQTEHGESSGGGACRSQWRWRGEIVLEAGGERPGRQVVNPLTRCTACSRCMMKSWMDLRSTCDGHQPSTIASPVSEQTLQLPAGVSGASAWSETSGGARRRPMTGWWSSLRMSALRDQRVFDDAESRPPLEPRTNFKKRRR